MSPHARQFLIVVLSALLGACASTVDDGPGAGVGEGGDAWGGAAGASPAAVAGATASSNGGTGAVAEGAGGDTMMGVGGSDTVAGAGGTAATDGMAGGAAVVPAGGAGGTGDVGTGAMVDVTCNPIAAGTSSVVVNGTNRIFDVQLPSDTSRMALLFVWHGWMQVPADFSSQIVYDVPSGQWVPFDPDAFPMPLMIVTPYDTKLIPPAGLDWDIVSGAQDFTYFDAMLECIQGQFEIDDTRIYSFGFSAGAVFTNLLSAQYPDLFAATISESGAWFNDTPEQSEVLVPLMQWQWPTFDPADGGNVLLTHGGPDDFATIISLENTNQKALPFLHDGGRTVVECAHTFGHTLDPDLTQSMYYDYLWAHQRGGPPLDGLPPGFPTPESPVGPTTCTFHPAP